MGDEIINALVIGDERLLPEYKSIKTVKTVRAVKIKEIGFTPSSGKAIIVPEGMDVGFMIITEPGFNQKFNGTDLDLGYYVLYPDTYQGWHSTQAFERQYTRGVI